MTIATCGRLHCAAVAPPLHRPLLPCTCSRFPLLQLAEQAAANRFSTGGRAFNPARASQCAPMREGGCGSCVNAPTFEVPCSPRTRERAPELQPLLGSLRLAARGACSAAGRTPGRCAAPCDIWRVGAKTAGGDVWALLPLRRPLPARQQLIRSLPLCRSEPSQGMGNCCSTAVPVDDKDNVRRKKSQRLANWSKTGVIALRRASLAVRHWHETTACCAVSAPLRRKVEPHSGRLAAQRAATPFPMPPLCTQAPQPPASPTHVQELPAEVAQVPSPRVLDASLNQIERLPQSLPVSLQRLVLSSNRLSSLAGLEQLRNLKVQGWPACLLARCSPGWALL